MFFDNNHETAKLHKYAHKKGWKIVISITEQLQTFITFLLFCVEFCQIIRCIWRHTLLWFTVMCMINRKKHFSTHFFTVCLLKSTSSAQSLQSSSCRLHLGSEWVSGSRHSKLAAPLVILETYYVSQWKKTLKSRVHFPITRTSFPLLCANPTALPKPNTLPCLDIAEAKSSVGLVKPELAEVRWRDFTTYSFLFFQTQKSSKDLSVA